MYLTRAAAHSFEGGVENAFPSCMKQFYCTFGFCENRQCGMKGTVFLRIIGDYSYELHKSSGVVAAEVGW